MPESENPDVELCFCPVDNVLSDKKVAALLTLVLLFIAESCFRL